MTETAPARACIGVGSNLDDPIRQVCAAADALAGLSGTALIARSALYRSAPFGDVEQPDFVNAVALIETTLAPGPLLEALQGIESAMGRRRDGPRWGPRVIDLDLLVYDDVTMDGPELTLPHPGIAERNFVLLPLREVAPGLEIPGLGPVRGIPVNKKEPRISRIA